MEKIIRELKLARGVLLHEDKVLLVQDQSPGQGHYFLPGGRVEPGESVRSALLREWDEELGWKVEIKSFLGCVEHTWTFHRKSDSSVVEVFEINFLFAVTCNSELYSMSLISKEPHLKFSWVSLDDLKSIKLLPEPLKTILPELPKQRMSGHWESTL